MDNTSKPDKALIFDIQHFSVHDGAGIRTTVFFKGCPLKCRWCSNPESQSFLPELMYNPAKCIGCGACIPKCPQKAIRIEDGRILFDFGRCDQCGACVDECYAEARTIKGREMSVQEVFDEIKKDMIFYSNSGGGVTCSGGEPLAQPEFLSSLLKMCKESGEMNTAIETCGCVPWKNVEMCSPYIDEFLYDIKHIDPEKHMEYTGGSNSQIMENCRRLAAMGKSIIIRVPVIPTFNAYPEVICAIADFAKEIGVKEINLLPYHRYAAGKYKLLMREYWDPGVSKESQEHLEYLAEQAKKTGVNILLGG